MILVTGGAGYIGSVTVRELLNNGHDVVVLDNFVKGRRFAVERNQALARKTGRACALAEGDLKDIEFIKKTIVSHSVKAVVHFAAFIEVAESVQRPALYFYNNIINTVHLLEAMARTGVKRIIFSSSAAVYGNPDSVPIKEQARTSPINPYGYTKLSMEKMISSYQKQFGIEWIALRYFNAAGASPDIELGESHSPESHLIPNAIDLAANNKKIKVFGNDYQTQDGTCLRDFISIADLAQAHRLALELKGEGAINRPYNLGSGSGFTVLQIAEEVGRALGVEPQVEFLPRRPGDPDKLVASSEAFQKAIGWRLQNSDIKDILKTAVLWYKTRPKEALEPKALPGADEKMLAQSIKNEFAQNKVIPQALKDEITGKLG